MESNEVITAKAIEFAEKYLDAAKNGKVDLLPVEKEWLDKGDDNFVYKYAQKFADDLRSNGYDKADEAKLNRLSEFKPADGVTWLLFNGADPESKFESDQFKKFQPLVENGKWMQMDKRALQDWANKHDYDMSDKASADQFWADLQRHDINYNKAKTVDDFSKSGAGIALALGAPSAYEEGVKQALTDDPMDTWKIGKQYANDAGTNLVMAALGSKFATNPLIAGGLQAGAEGVRQGIKKGIDRDLELQGTPILATFGAGATVPFLVRGPASFAKQSTNESVRNFGKGMMRGAKGYDSGVDELNAIKQHLIDARKKVTPRTGYSGVAEDANLKAKSEAQKDLLALGFGSEPYTTVNGQPVMMFSRKSSYNRLLNKQPGQRYSIADILNPDKVSNKDAMSAVQEAYKGDYGKNFVTLDNPSDFQAMETKLFAKDPYDADKIVNMSRDNKDNALGLISDRTPERYASLSGAENRVAHPKLYKAIKPFVGDYSTAESKGGYAVGKVLGGVGGTVEPAFKINPYSMATDVATTGDATQVMKAKTTDYQQQDWYKQLRIRNPQMADAIDAAFKAKE